MLGTTGSSAVLLSRKEFKFVMNTSYTGNFIFTLQQKQSWKIENYFKFNINNGREFSSENQGFITNRGSYNLLD